MGQWEGWQQGWQLVPKPGSTHLDGLLDMNIILKALPLQEFTDLPHCPLHLHGELWAGLQGSGDPAIQLPGRHCSQSVHECHRVHIHADRYRSLCSLLTCCLLRLLPSTTLHPNRLRLSAAAFKPSRATAPMRHFWELKAAPGRFPGMLRVSPAPPLRGLGGGRSGCGSP